MSEIIRRFARMLGGGGEPKKPADLYSSVDPADMDAVQKAAKLPGTLSTVRSLGEIAGDIGEGKPVNRRDILKLGGSAAVAASGGLQALRRAGTIASIAGEGFVPQIPKLMPPGLVKGFDLPGNSTIMRMGDSIALDTGDLESWMMRREELEKLQQAVREAHSALSRPAPPGVSSYNQLTKSWHVPLKEVIESKKTDSGTWVKSARRWLREGQAAPDNMPDGWSLDGTDWGQHAPETFQELSEYGGKITGLTPDDLLRDWKAGRKAELDYENSLSKEEQAERLKDPRARQNYLETLREFGLAPGGRADQQPVMDIDPDPYRRGTLDKRWGRLPAVPFERVGKGTFLAAPIGAALLSGQEESR